MTDGVVIVEADDTVSLVNQAAADMLDVRPRMEGHASLADALRDNDLVEFILAPTSTEQPSARLLTVGATEREVHSIAVPLGVPGLRQRLVLLRDLTDLRQTETVRRDFVANVSHELRTPLTRPSARSSKRCKTAPPTTPPPAPNSSTASRSKSNA